MKTRFPTNRTPNYWVNWKKVNFNVSDIEIKLNTMDYLVGKNDIKNKAYTLFSQQPDLIEIIPILIACRDNQIDVLRHSASELSYYNLNFAKPDDDLDKYIEFMEECGLLDFLKNKVTKSLVDYVFGVEVGLDSNGRKNRSGTENENILENNLKLVVKHNPHCQYGTQETAKSIKQKWDVVVPEALDKKRKGGRRYDGVIYNTKSHKVVIIETNFYGGGGSKLKAVAGEFSEMYRNFLKEAPDVDFVWISDGPGWNAAKNPMHDAFEVIPNIINLQMVNDGFLTDIINK
ncbi:type II restriction endonuclease [Apilactobacillus xinyiensis]|uniref:type II restriction endonuclease n=1 Tax=Apilactobacillus xinyiensis TaxID=2841032 RepID=UPI00203547A0|nr:type II restriction endonuclease [Apilactobacillus xinyiensis]